MSQDREIRNVSVSIFVQARDGWYRWTCNRCGYRSDPEPGDGSSATQAVMAHYEPPGCPGPLPFAPPSVKPWRAWLNRLFDRLDHWLGLPS